MKTKDERKEAYENEVINVPFRRKDLSKVSAALLVTSHDIVLQMPDDAFELMVLAWHVIQTEAKHDGEEIEDFKDWLCVNGKNAN